jgi:hypothetical protein
MSRLSVLANPKNTWLLYYEKAVLDQFLGLLSELNASAKAITYRYKFIAEGEPDSPRRDFGFDKESNMQRHALNGIGTALIIGTDLLLKDVQNSAANAKSEQNEKKVARINGVAWEDCIRAAGNYVRHGDEWEKLYKRYCEKTGVPHFSFEDRPELINAFMEDLKNTKHMRAYNSIKRLEKFGLDIETNLLLSQRIWDMAENIQLTNVGTSMNLMRQYLESYKYGPQRKKSDSK